MNKYTFYFMEKWGLKCGRENKSQAMEKVILVLQSSLSIAMLWQNTINSELYNLGYYICIL